MSSGKTRKAYTTIDKDLIGEIKSDDYINLIKIMKSFGYTFITPCIDNLFIKREMKLLTNSILEI